MRKPLMLIQQYVQGWRENNLEKIISVLTKDYIIIESHGPTYHGIESVKKWFRFWLKERGKVL